MFRLLLGNKESLEKQIYVTATLIGAFIGLVSVIWNYTIGLSIYLNTVVFLATIIFLLLYYFSRFKDRYSAIIVVLNSLSTLSCLWFISEGINGTTPYIFIVFSAVVIGVSKPGHRIIYLIISLINIGALYTLERLYYDELIIKYPDEAARESDIIFGFILSLFLIYMTVLYFKKVHEREHKRITSQKAELQNLIASKDLLFKIIAHDLRGPFNSILGFSSIMANRSNGHSLEEMQELAGIMNRSTREVYYLLETLLDWGKIQQGQVKLNPESISLLSAVKQSVYLYTEDIDLKMINIKYEIDENCTVRYDLNVLNTIVRNLLNNAIKFTKRGGRITFFIRERNTLELYFCIKDTGIGMNEETVEKLFNLDVTNSRQGTEGEASSGLGLIICKELVKMSHGVFEVESEENEGSEFRFSIPKA